MLGRADQQALALIGVGALALIGFDLAIYQPQALAIACAHAARPGAACLARAGAMTLNRQGLFGALALGLGIVALLRGGRGLITGAILAGIAGMLFHNVTWGALGAALAGWRWISPPRMGSIRSGARPG